MFRWLRFAPDAAEVEESHGESHFELKVKTVDEVKTFAPKWGVPYWYKLFVYVCVLFPKLMIAIYMWIVGTAYIVLSESNSDLIIDTLAVGFVADIDDIVFRFTTSPQMTTAIESLPPIHPPPLRGQARLFTATSPNLSTPEGGLPLSPFDVIVWMQRYGVLKIVMLAVVSYLAYASDMILCGHVFGSSHDTLDIA